MPRELKIEVDVKGLIGRFGTVSDLMAAARAAGTTSVITRHAVMKWIARNSMPLRAYAALVLTAKDARISKVSLQHHIKASRIGATAA